MKATAGAGRQRTRGLSGSLLAVAALVALPTSAWPQAIATNAFDGVYAGVSAVNNSAGNTLRGGERTSGYAGSRSCRDFRKPARLTIANGQAQANWGQYVLRGAVTPQGRLVMTTGYGQRFEGQIESQNTVTGRLVGYCAYTLTWRKTA